MSRDPNCVFCSIIAGDIPASVVFENEGVLAFLDVGPLSEGHVLVIPRQHYERVVDMPGPALAEIAIALPKLGRALLKVTKVQAFNVLVNNGEVAGQVVPHVHFHLIPRLPGDGLGYRWNAGSYESGRIDELAAAYQAALGAQA
ncbi:MAG: HIT family protein [Planctomycetes bacterium]|nr:HIT family protein [Planctomycetota bacterium]